MSRHMAASLKKEIAKDRSLVRSADDRRAGSARSKPNGRLPITAGARAAPITAGAWRGRISCRRCTRRDRRRPSRRNIQV